MIYKYSNKIIIVLHNISKSLSDKLSLLFLDKNNKKIHKKFLKLFVKVFMS